MELLATFILAISMRTNSKDRECSLTFPATFLIKVFGGSIICTKIKIYCHLKTKMIKLNPMIPVILARAHFKTALVDKRIRVKLFRKRKIKISRNQKKLKLRKRVNSKIFKNIIKVFWWHVMIWILQNKILKSKKYPWKNYLGNLRRIRRL